MKIKIAGAGIAGLVSAINLAKNGIDVEIYEQSSFVGSRFSGDLQGLENWSEKENILETIQNYGVELNFDYGTCFNDFKIFTNKSEYPLAKQQEPIYYTVQRGPMKGSLDYSLYNQVLKYPNIKINFNSNVKDFSDFDIVAVGPQNFQSGKMDGVESGYVFKTDLEGFGSMILSNNYAPGGYSYFLTLNGNAVIASVASRSFEKINNYREKTFEFYKNKLNFKILNEPKSFGGVGNFFVLDQSDSKKIYIGESGGFQDFLLGFGMRYAMQTGYIAAKSILENVSFYEEVKKELGDKMKASIIDKSVYKNLNGGMFDIFVKTANLFGVRKSFNYLYNYHSWENLIFPFFQKANKDKFVKL